jgi:uncharacterized protein YbjT (DUF2867 family)
MGDQTGRVALLAGASGLVGSRLLPLLLGATEYSRVLALTRRPLLLDHARLANRVVRFDAGLEKQLAGLRCNDAFCCLGTTLREAGGQEGFRAVDQDLVLKIARIAQAAGAERLVVISSVGASDASKNFYLRVKGETERALERLQFGALDIIQPSVLLGMRRHIRPLEFLAQAALSCVNPLLLGTLARYRGMAAGEVAAAMLGAARGGRRGVNRYTVSELRALATAGFRQSARL